MRPARVCAHPGCAELVRGSSYCPHHMPQPRNGRNRQRFRQNAGERGYGAEWRAIRAEVLTRHGIPRHQWHLYAVDHRPRYNKAIEPDHRKYELVPMLKSEHNRKTARDDGGFGNPKKGRS